MPGKDEVESFIRSTFQSVWSLELLRFVRSEPRRSWRHEELVSGLRASDLVIAQGVSGLAAAGLLLADGEGGARYEPVSPALDELVAATLAYYAKSPDTVRRLIVSSQNVGLAAFADAFRLRKD